MNNFYRVTGVIRTSGTVIGFYKGETEEDAITEYFLEFKNIESILHVGECAESEFDSYEKIKQQKIKQIENKNRWNEHLKKLQDKKESKEFNEYLLHFKG